MNKIEKFKHSIDYRDICYFIDHVENIDFRISLLEELGYNVGVLIVKQDFGEKHIIIGKKKEIRMQVTPKYKNINVARCVII